MSRTNQWAYSVSDQSKMQRMQIIRVMYNIQTGLSTTTENRQLLIYFKRFFVYLETMS